jgi:hypothetical protein
LYFASDNGAFQCVKCQCVWMVLTAPVAWSGVLDDRARPVVSPFGDHVPLAKVWLGAVGIAAAILLLCGLWLVW